MIDIIIKGQLAVTCLPELAPLIVQMLIPQIGLEYSIETKQHKEKEVD